MSLSVARARVYEPADGAPMHVALILAVRRLHNWTQAELGFHLGVSDSTIANWEQCRREPATIWLDRLRELAKRNPQDGVV